MNKLVCINQKQGLMHYVHKYLDQTNKLNNLECIEASSSKGGGGITSSLLVPSAVSVVQKHKKNIGGGDRCSYDVLFVLFNPFSNVTSSHIVGPTMLDNVDKKFKQSQTLIHHFLTVFKRGQHIVKVC